MMTNWTDPERLSEAGLPLLAFLLKEEPQGKWLYEEYEADSTGRAMAIRAEVCRTLKEEQKAERLFHLHELCGEMGAMLLDCALACAFYPELEALLAKHFEGGLSFSMLGSLDIAGTYGQMWDAYQKLARVLPMRKQEEALFFRTTFYVDQRILNHIAGVDELPKELQHFVSLVHPGEELQPMYVDASLTANLEKMLCGGYPLQLVGENGRGKRLLLRHTLAEMGRFGIFVDGKALAGEKGILELLWKIGREALLLDGVVCVYGIDQAWMEKYSTSLLPLLHRGFHEVPLCLCTERGMNLTDSQSGDWNRMELPILKQEDCIALWQGYCRQFEIDLDPKRLGSKYRMSPAQIAKAARRISQEELPTAQVLLKSCIDVLPAAGSNIRQIQTSYTFDDLKVAPKTRAVLDNICAHVNYREQVYGQWGLESRYAYGKSVSALFSGPPGTGKTMAAHVLSSELSLPLYSINLSQIVDKYIGETEKKLEQVFTIAERSNTILFFDEADSLFGKRSEVNDSKDRYANIEVSYILQRMEQYDGIVILATNHRNNIDEAFLRRIRYATEFALPDEKLRKEIWEGCFSAQTPLLDVDFDFIARKFEFSGGDIKNIALNAAFLAAQEGSAGIGMEHVLGSIRMEYQKANRMLTQADMAEYGYLLQNM